MNVYTHVAMNDLHDDVESLPGLPGNGSAGPGEVEPGAGGTNAPSVDAPDELAGLISSWNDLPANVRSAITALANA